MRKPNSVRKSMRARPSSKIDARMSGATIAFAPFLSKAGRVYFLRCCCLPVPMWRFLGPRKRHIGRPGKRPPVSAKWHKAPFITKRHSVQSTKLRIVSMHIARNRVALLFLYLRCLLLGQS